MNKYLINHLALKREGQVFNQTSVKSLFYTLGAHISLLIGPSLF